MGNILFNILKFNRKYENELQHKQLFYKLINKKKLSIYSSKFTC